MIEGDKKLRRDFVFSFEMIFKSRLVGEFCWADLAAVRGGGLVNFLHVRREIRPEKFIAHRALVRL